MQELHLCLTSRDPDWAELDYSCPGDTRETWKESCAADRSLSYLPIYSLFCPFAWFAEKCREDLHGDDDLMI